MNQQLVSGTLLALLACQSASADMRYVPEDYPTIQAAIDDCSEGDRVLVAPGIYQEPGNGEIDFRGKAIVVQCHAPNDPSVVDATIVDCRSWRNGFVFRSGEGNGSVLAGLTIANGSFGRFGAAIEIVGSSPLVDRCVIRDNASSARSRGTGIHIGGGSPVITNCIIAGNSTGGSGVAIYSEWANPTIEHCIITNNQSATGAAIKIKGEPDPLAGGPRIQFCRIQGNRTITGASAIDCGLCSPQIRHCLIAGNLSEYDAPAIQLALCDSHLINCTIADNGGLSFQDHLGLSCTNISIENCIFYNHSLLAPSGIQVYAFDCFHRSPGEIFDVNEITTRLDISYSNIQGGREAILLHGDPNLLVLSWGQGNIDKNPLFAHVGTWDRGETLDDPSDDSYATGDYHLKSRAGRWGQVDLSWMQDEQTSPCIDAGDPNMSVAYELLRNGGIINMGMHGGTVFASQSVEAEAPAKSWSQLYGELLASVEPPEGRLLFSRRSRGYLRSVATASPAYFSVPNTQGQSAEEITQAFIHRWHDLLMADSAAIVFEVSRVHHRSYGTILDHRQTYSGLEVYAADIVMQIDNGGGVVLVSSNIMVDAGVFNSRPDLLTPSISRFSAQQMGEAYMANRFAGRLHQAEDPLLTIFDFGVVGKSGTPRLVWRMNVRPLSGSCGTMLLVDAHTGDVVHENPLCMR